MYSIYREDKKFHADADVIYPKNNMSSHPLVVVWVGGGGDGGCVCVCVCVCGRGGGGTFVMYKILFHECELKTLVKWAENSTGA